MDLTILNLCQIPAGHVYSMSRRLTPTADSPTSPCTTTGHGSPDFVAYRSSPLSWDNGDELTEAERAAVFEDLVRSAAERGMWIEVE
jgi:hypothetical protein